MTISASDLKFIAAERMIDGDTGGGLMGTTIVSGAAENNVFPDVMPGDRASGNVQFRRVFPTVLSLDNDLLSSAETGFAQRPSDPSVFVSAFLTDVSLDGNSFVSAARGVLQQPTWGTSTVGSREGDSTVGSNVLAAVSDFDNFEVGELVRVATAVGVGISATYEWRHVTAQSSSTLTISGAAFPYATRWSVRKYYAPHFANGAYRPSALSLTTAGVSSGSSTLAVDRLDTRTETAGSLYLVGSGGSHRLYYPGDRVLVEHATVPATREFATVARVNYATGTLYFVSPLANAYPTGSKVIRPLALGGLQSSAPLSFSQQTWVRTWADAASGASVAARYSAPIGMVNAGATTDRWACVFTGASTFNLLSERLGQIGSGNTGVNFLPLNPLTNQPYFTLYSSGWGSGWLPGNVLRLNTLAAAPAKALWLVRCVLPSAAGGTDQATLFFRGDVNA